MGESGGQTVNSTSAVQQRINYHIRNASGRVIYLCYYDEAKSSESGDSWWATPATELINGVYPALRWVFLQSLPHAIEKLNEVETILVKRGKAQC